MKTDLVTSIGAAIVGALIAYFVCNLFLGPIEPVTFKTVSSTVSTELTNPDVKVFNYKAINPTIEVYVDCQEYDEAGECTEDNSADTDSNSNQGNP